MFVQQLNCNIFNMDSTNTIPVIQFENVNISNSGNLVISDLNLSIEKGEFIYIIGKVGSGKTSIIRSMIGEIPIEQGKARVGKFNLNKLKKREIPYLRRNIGVIFQDLQLLTDRTVYENLHFVLKATGWKDKKLIDQTISQVLEAVGMSNKAGNKPHQLSGGEQQRVAIARALLNKPGIILADEPTANLDNDTTREIMELFMKIHKEQGPTIIMVTHNKTLLKDYPGKTYLCEKMSCTYMKSFSEIEIDFSDFI